MFEAHVQTSGLLGLHCCLHRRTVFNGYRWWLSWPFTDLRAWHRMTHLSACSSITSNHIKSLKNNLSVQVLSRLCPLSAGIERKEMVALWHSQVPIRSLHQAALPAAGGRAFCLEMVFMRPSTSWCRSCNAGHLKKETATMSGRMVATKRLFVAQF